MQAACVDSFDEMDCRAAVRFCDSELSTGYHASGMTQNFSTVNLLHLLSLCIYREECLRYLKGRSSIVNLQILTDVLIPLDDRTALGTPSVTWKYLSSATT